MYTQNEQALSRPRNVFDLPALSILALAAAGRSALRVAYALDAVRSASRASSRGGPHRPRTSVESYERHGVVDSWRVK